jgi:tRNA-binding EMAP/Myf-like protein
MSVLVSLELKTASLKKDGEVSEGMLCSANELELDYPGYDGILILDDALRDRVGEAFERKSI